MGIAIENYFRDPELETKHVQSEVWCYSIVIRQPDLGWITVAKFLYQEFDSEDFWTSIHYKISTLLFHRVKFPETVFNTRKEFLEFIDQHYPNRTPSEKMERVLMHIYSLSNFDGDTMTINQEDIKKDQLDKELYFKNCEEVIFYIRVLYKKGYIDWQNDASRQFLGLYITVEGLSKIISLEEISNSKLCFVAMSFHPTMEFLFEESIKPALIATGFKPSIVSKEHIASDKTINDAILAGIKKSKFTIADFTQHRDGVYFEAGYALGRGQKIIYTCSEKDMGAAHFDTSHYQHIVWKDAADLKRQLIDKIEAFILD